jgi:hypothetical protein
MQQRSIQNGRRLGSRSMLVFLAFAGIALFFLLGEHRIHALGWLPLLLLLACPLLHMTMHGGHGGHDSPQPGRASDSVLPQEGAKI